MAALNPMQLVMMLKQGNPQMVAEQIIQSNFSNNAGMVELMKMAQNGNIQGIEQFAREFFNSKGLNYENEMQNFMNIMKNI